MKSKDRIIIQKIVGYISDVENLHNIPNLDSAEILSEWAPHTKTFTYQGETYIGNFREKELEQIMRGNITENILKKAKKISR